MNKSWLIQAFMSLLVGAGVFYISAPHSWGIGVYIQEPIYIFLSLFITLAILIPACLIIFKHKRIYYGSVILFSFIGIVLVSYFYPAHERYSTPSDTIEADVSLLLKDEGMPSNVRFKINLRKKVPFDLLSEHRWEGEISGSKSGTYLYFYYTERFGNGELIMQGEKDWSKLN
ncbi:hypothetical protein [Kangiella shandongensis]|uniref:hypothetical protein n=1 Tax=Kangiella shandongensis TaxID=2763258 RepID=UPI001CBFCDFD|nr:hypothetical protein [Kangiella shandongensis]